MAQLDAHLRQWDLYIYIYEGLRVARLMKLPLSLCLQITGTATSILYILATSPSVQLLSILTSFETCFTELYVMVKTKSETQ